MAAGTDQTGLGNGIIITGVKSGFCKPLNTAPDMTSHVSVQCTYSNSPVDVEPEKFRDMGTTAASITFSQLDSSKAETWNVVCEYTIYKRG